MKRSRRVPAKNPLRGHGADEVASGSPSPTERASARLALPASLRLVLAFGLAWAGLPAAAAPSVEATREDEMDAVDSELMEALQEEAWVTGAELEVAAGYRSNPLLAAFNAGDTAVIRGNLNVFAWRLPVDGWEWTNLLDVTYSHNLAHGVDDSSFALVRSGWRLSAGDMLYSVAGKWLHHDEVVDASDLDSGFGSVRARLSSPGVELGLSRTFGSAWTGGLKLEASQSDFAAPLDDFASYAATLQVERALGLLGAAGVELSWGVREFESRTQVAVGGRPLDGTSLSIYRPSGSIWHEIRGGAEARWRVRTRLGYRANNDNGPGWYDYGQISAAVSASLETAAWMWTADLDWDGSLYRVQTVGYGNPPRRTLESTVLELRGERELSDRWSCFLEGSMEFSRSNDPFQTYDDLLLLIGLRWSS